MKQMERLEDHFDHAGVPPRLRGVTIASLKTAAAEAAEGTRYEDDPLSGKHDAVEATETLKNCGTYDGRNGLLLYGSNGMGKTGLMVILCRAAYLDGYVPLFLKYTDFVQSVQAGYGREASGISGQALGLELSELRMRIARTAPVLVIDDLGDPFARDDRYEETEDRRKLLFQVIAARHEEGRPTHLNANFASREEMIVQFGPRIADRMREMSAEVQMTGANLRDAS
jgi:DNA replication protein DnaC